MPKLVNLGSLCIDNVYRVPAIAAAGETVASRSHEVFPGGKGLNQSVAAARAGAAVAHVGCVGADGAWLRDLLAQEGVDVDGVRVVEGASGHAVIQVDDAGANAIAIAGGANRTLRSDDVACALDQVGPNDWLLLQNEINDLPDVLAAAKQRGCALAFNVAPVDGREADYDLSGVQLLIVNEIEAAALAAATGLAGTDTPDAAARALRDRYPRTEVVLTLGAAGLVHIGANGASTLPAFAAQAVDETAAGDAFIGYLMAALLTGEDMAQALRLGSAAGALAVTKAGAAASIPTLAEVRQLAAGGSSPSSTRM